MSQCIRCHNDAANGKFCQSCLDNWAEMRTQVFDILQKKYGKMSPENHAIFIKETKRLEKIWRKDKEQFQTELKNIKV